MSRGCESFEHLHSAWVDGELRASERAALGAHLQRCARCRAAIDELRVTSAMLRSLPVRNLVIDIDRGPARRRPIITAAGVRLVAARSAMAAVLVTATVGAAAFFAGAQQPADRQVAVPVDVFVADHLVRSVGGPVSTPALLNAQP
jgi:anti-sigma factor RsiW